MAKVTVLVAVFNASDYLKKCLDSLLNQTHKDLQIVCVDDASTDDSLSILRSYSERDSRIEVVSMLENIGMAKARNVALQRANGDFVCMLDADDWYGEDAIEQAVSVFENYDSTDVVLFQFMYVYPDHEQLFPLPQFTVLDGRTACTLSLDWRIHGIYMVRRDIHQRYPYDDSCRLYSDENTTRIHYAVSREVRCCSGIYYYRQHALSMTHKPTVRQFDKLKAKENLICCLQALNLDVEKLRNMLWFDIVDLYMFYHVHGCELTEDERQWGLQELHRAWSTIDRTLLDRKTTRKFGYRVMPTWALFRLQEWLYFTLRGFLGKNV